MNIEERDVLELSNEKTSKEPTAINNALEAEKTVLCSILSFWGESVLLNGLSEEDFLNPVCRKVFSLLKAGYGKKAEELSSFFESAGLSIEYVNLLNYASHEAIRDVKKVITALERDVVLSKMEVRKESFKRSLILKEGVSEIAQEIKRLEKDLLELDR